MSEDGDVEGGGGSPGHRAEVLPRGAAGLTQRTCTTVRVAEIWLSYMKCTRLKLLHYVGNAVRLPVQVEVPAGVFDHHL